MKILKNIKKLINKLRGKIWTLPLFITLMSKASLATTSGAISTAEVSQATENIRNAVMKLAMPIR